MGCPEGLGQLGLAWHVFKHFCLPVVPPGETCAGKIMLSSHLAEKWSYVLISWYSPWHIGFAG